MTKQEKINCPEDCLLKGEGCPIGNECPPILVGDSAVKICEHYQNPSGLRGRLREVIDLYADDECLYQDEPCESHYRAHTGIYCSCTEGSYKCLMKRLDELGLVRKVDLDQAKMRQSGFSDIKFGIAELYRAGFVATESLVEE